MQVARIAFVSAQLAIAVGCSKRTADPARVTRESCLAVRDHAAELITGYYQRHPEETFDGLDRSDLAVMVGIPPGVKRETFGTWLASEAARQWLANARVRLISGSGLTDFVGRCTKGARPEHVACWTAAATMETFQACPIP
jgi:hypothetical protein